jgi:ELWxxDGT repeat protein
VVVGNRLYFPGNDGVSGEELWRSDGTAAGTALVKNINANCPQHSSYPTNLASIGGKVFFRASDGTEVEPWVSDGTASGTRVLKPLITPGTPGPFPLLAGFHRGPAGIAYFAANDRVHGYEPWRSDGTEAGTRILKNIAPGSKSSDPGGYVSASGRLFFYANDRTVGSEPWSSNGTAAGTALVEDIYPGSGSSNPAWLTRVGRNVLFSARAPNLGRELWILRP